jgi:carboxypeptidase T
MKNPIKVVASLCLIVLLVSPLAGALHGPQSSVSMPSAVSSVYFTYESMTAMLQGLAANHSDIMSLFSIGTTYEGRTIWAVKLSDTVNQDEGEPEILFMGAHHGNEKPGSEVCLRFIQYVTATYHMPDTDNDHDGMLNEDPIDGVDNDKDGLIDEDPSESFVRTLVNATEIFVIPMVNPDGYAADQRKNQEPNHGWFGHKAKVTSSGVDINRNYGYKWNRWFLHPRLYFGSTKLKDNSEVYRGPSPFSTAEASAVRDFVNGHAIDIAISYHTFGGEILYPWGYTRLPPRDLNTFVAIGDNISHIDGYRVEQSIQLYPTLGDACDWMYGTKGILAFTIELGTSTYAPEDPAEIDTICLEHIGVNLLVCACARAMSS